MSKTMKISSIVLLVYLAMCAVVLVCMPLYTAYYPSAFSSICFRIGGIMMLLTMVNPMGLIAAIVNGFCYGALRRQGAKMSRMMGLWAFNGVFLALIGWLSAVIAFVHHSGGV